MSRECDLPDRDRQTLGELKRLERLSLAGSGLGDDGIKHLAGLTNLEALDLPRTKASPGAPGSPS